MKRTVCRHKLNIIEKICEAVSNKPRFKFKLVLTILYTRFGQPINYMIYISLYYVNSINFIANRVIEVDLSLYTTFYRSPAISSSISPIKEQQHCVTAPYGAKGRQAKCFATWVYQKLVFFLCFATRTPDYNNMKCLYNAFMYV